MGHEHLRKLDPLMKCLDHAWLGNPNDCALGRSDRRGHPNELAGKATFATKITGFEECDHRFLSLVGYDAELHLSVLDIKHGVGWRALGKDDLPLAIGRGRHSTIERRHECAGIKWLLCLLFAHRNSCLPFERGALDCSAGFLPSPPRWESNMGRAESKPTHSFGLTCGCPFPGYRLSIGSIG